MCNTDTDTYTTHTHIQNPVLEKSTFPFSGTEKPPCDEITLIVWSFTEGRREITWRAGIRWNLAIIETWLLLCHLPLAIALQLPLFLPTQWRNRVTAATEAKRFPSGLAAFLFVLRQLKSWSS